MKKDFAKVKILGTKYNIYKSDKEKDKRLSNCDGFCDFYQKEIVIQRQEDNPDDIESMRNLKFYEKKILRHEIVHAFLFESGLDINSNDISQWARNEEMVDWIAIQFPKMEKIFKKLDIL